MTGVEQLSMAELFAPTVNAYLPSIVTPDNVRNLEIKGHLSGLIPKLCGEENEDVIGFLKELEHFIGWLTKGENVTDNDLKMKAFPICLADKARQWMNDLDRGSLTTWSDVYNAFMNRHYPRFKTFSIRQLIRNFSQLCDESLYETWNRFKSLLAQCPHHRYPQADLNQFFL